MTSDKHGFLICEVREQGQVSLRLGYYDHGLKRRRLGILPVSPTPALDVILASTDRLTVDELIRLRNADKSWSRLPFAA